MTIILKVTKFGDMDMMIKISFSLIGNIYKEHVCHQLYHVPREEYDPQSSKKNIITSIR